MSQKIEHIAVEDLVLWTENPRDPVDPSASDQDIVDRAIADSESKWKLATLAKEMGPHFDYSELPTVVYHGEKPVVYNGNRRVALAKIKFGLVTVKNFSVELPDFPRSIPCNVCSKEIALRNVLRKHAGAGSWLPLERDIFLHKHMGEKKTAFLLFEENTGLISENKHLNQRFVKEEIFEKEPLERLGLSFDGDRLLSKHSPEETRSILDDLSRKILDKEITTRKNRGKVLEVLEPANQKLVRENDTNTPQPLDLKTGETTDPTSRTTMRRSRRTKPKDHQLFGGPLYLRIGPVSDLYRDIVDLYDFYLTRKGNLSSGFPSLIRMALRLLWETAARDGGEKPDRYIKKRFKDAKSLLSQDQRTTLSSHNVTEASIIQLLHIGAHNYSVSSNIEQTIAISLILGGVLTLSHGKEDKR